MAESGYTAEGIGFGTVRKASEAMALVGSLLAMSSEAGSELVELPLASVIAAVFSGFVRMLVSTHH